MTQNQIRNIGVSIFCVLIVGFAAILNPSLIGSAAAAVMIAAILLIAFSYQKDQSIVEKIDLYVLSVFLGVLVAHYDQLRHTFSKVVLSNSLLNQNINLRIGALIIGYTLCLILLNAAKKSPILAVKIIAKYLGMFFAVVALLIFFLARAYLVGLPQLVVIFSSFGFIAYCRANRTSDVKMINRLSYIAILLAGVSLVLSIAFPMFHLSEFNATAFLSTKVFPWYSVLGTTLVLMSIVGLGLSRDESVIDEDTVVLAGAVGLIWVVKASVFYFFSYSWIAICLYSLVFFGLANRFIKREASGRKTSLGSPLNENEFYWLMIAAAGVVTSVFLISIGYLYFLLALVLGTIVVLFLPGVASENAKDAFFWAIILFSIAGAACMLSFQSGLSAKKFVLIAGLFTFSSIVMLMLNHHNSVGQNKFNITKTVMVIVFTLLVIIPAFKAGAHIKASFSDRSASSGSLVKKQSDLLVSATADGKSNYISSLSYVWTDTFFYSSRNVMRVGGAKAKLNVEHKHLIVWAIDAYGVVTRKDCWFYDAARGNSPSGGIYRIGQVEKSLKQGPARKKAAPAKPADKQPIRK